MLSDFRFELDDSWALRRNVFVWQGGRYVGLVACARPSSVLYPSVHLVGFSDGRGLSEVWHGVGVELPAAWSAR